MNRPTLEAVAARAGVSGSSVSRVVNGQPTVAPQIRDVVLRAVAELGYVPNGTARGTGRIVATDTPYDMPYVAVVTASNGHITHYRDYWSPSAIPGSLNDAKFFSGRR